MRSLSFYARFDASDETTSHFNDLYICAIRHFESVQKNYNELFYTVPVNSVKKILHNQDCKVLFLVNGISGLLTLNFTVENNDKDLRDFINDYQMHKLNTAFLENNN